MKPRTKTQGTPAPAAAPKSPAGASVVSDGVAPVEPVQNDWARLTGRPHKIDTILISQLERDPELNCRAAGVRDDLARKYAEAMRLGSKFPAVIVFRDKAGKNWLADGFHRCAAVELRQGSSVFAEVREGGREDALLYAAGANAARGLGRTNADKRRAALALLVAWSNRTDAWIALQCGVSDRFVAKLRPATPNGSESKRKGVDGKERKLPKKGKRKPASPEKQAKIARRELDRVKQAWPKGMPLGVLVRTAREWLGSLEANDRSSTTGGAVQEASHA
jgi:hypothetical protein